MSDTKMTAEKASNELVDYRNLLMENPSDTVIDTGTLMAKAMELFLKIEKANGVDASDSGLHLQRVRIPLHKIEAAANEAMKLTELSKIPTTERERELGKKAWMNGAIWADYRLNDNEA